MSIYVSFIDFIVDKLDGCGGFVAEHGTDHITIFCENPESFEVSIRAFGDEFQVSFDGWHEHFKAEQDAIDCFTFGLSEECRLRVVKRGDMECSWTVQYWQDGRWLDDTTTGLIFVPFWRPKTIEYRHNRIDIKSSGVQKGRR